MMRNILLICMMLLGFSVHAFAQKEIVVTGIVTDTNKEPLIGVNVSCEYARFRCDNRYKW